MHLKEIQLPDNVFDKLTKILVKKVVIKDN